MTNEDKEELIKQDMQRIVQLEPGVHKLIGLLDLGVSDIYEREETLKIATTLGNTLAQMDSDLAALIELLD